MRRPGSRPSTADTPSARPAGPAGPAGVRVRPQRHRLHHRRAARRHRAGHRRADRPQRLSDLHRLPAPAGPVHRPAPEHPPGHGQRVIAHLQGHPGLDRRASPDHRHLHPEARLLAGHGRAVVLRADPRHCCAAASSPPAPTSPRRSPASRSATTGPPGPGPGPTTPAPTTRGTAPATAASTQPAPPPSRLTAHNLSQAA